MSSLASSSASSPRSRPSFAASTSASARCAASRCAPCRARAHRSSRRRCATRARRLRAAATRAPSPAPAACAPPTAARAGASLSTAGSPRAAAPRLGASRFPGSASPRTKTPAAPHATEGHQPGVLALPSIRGSCARMKSARSPPTRSAKATLEDSSTFIVTFRCVSRSIAQCPAHRHLRDYSPAPRRPSSSEARRSPIRCWAWPSQSRRRSYPRPSST